MVHGTIQQLIDCVDETLPDSHIFMKPTSANQLDFCKSIGAMVPKGYNLWYFYVSANDILNAAQPVNGFFAHLLMTTYVVNPDFSAKIPHFPAKHKIFLQTVKDAERVLLARIQLGRSRARYLGRPRAFFGEPHVVTVWQLRDWIWLHRDWPCHPYNEVPIQEASFQSAVIDRPASLGRPQSRCSDSI